jgi:Na+/glutamate symporter
MMGKELAVLLPGTHEHMLVVVGARPLLPASMRRGLRRVALQLLLLLPLWDLRLPGLARAELLVLVIVLVSTDMWIVVGPLVVLMHMLVLARARLLLHGLLDREL